MENTNKPALTIAFIGMDKSYFEYDEDPELFDVPEVWITDFLKKKYDVRFAQTIEESSDYDQNLVPDLVIAVTENLDYQQYLRYFRMNVPIVLYNGENCFPRLDLFDYVISCSHFMMSPRYAYVPFFVTWNQMHYGTQDIDKIIVDKSNEVDKSVVGVISNWGSDYRRELLSPLLSALETEGYPYKIFGNGPPSNFPRLGGDLSTKMKELSKHDFSLAIENSVFSGYVTEKISDSFIAGTIPIYGGSQAVSEFFCPSSYFKLTPENGTEIARTIKSITDKDIMELKLTPKVMDLDRLNNYIAKMEYLISYAIQRGPQICRTNYRHNTFAGVSGS